MEYVTEKAMEVLTAAWPGLAGAVLVWMGAKAWKWVRTPGVVSDECRLFNHLRDMLSNPNVWTVSSNHSTVETQAGVTPKMIVNTNRSQPGASIGGEDMNGIICRGKLKKLADMANRIVVVKEEQKRQDRIAKTVNAVNALPVVNAPQVVKMTHPSFPADLNNAGK